MEFTKMKLIELPDVVLETILFNLSYDEIARNRVVCKQFDRIGKTLLNRGFNSMEKYHAQCVRAVKSQLPRRESERRIHPLARHCDILAAIETRISMLSMTFAKYIDLNLCCFIPGKVIDEIFRVLRLIRVSKTPPRAHEILQELRDISSMAMEHFDEKILPDLKHNLCSSIVGNLTSSYDLSSTSLMMSRHSSTTGSSPFSHSFTSDKLKQIFKKIYSRNRKNKLGLLTASTQIAKMNSKIKRQSAHIRHQSIKLQEAEAKLQVQDQQFAEMKKHLEEFEQKVGDLTAKVSRAQEDTDVVENHKRKHIDFIKNQDNEQKSKELQTKKRKLIIERQIPLDAQDVKFKKFMSNLLGNSSVDDSTT